MPPSLSFAPVGVSAFDYSKSPVKSRALYQSATCHKSESSLRLVRRKHPPHFLKRTRNVPLVSMTSQQKSEVISGLGLKRNVTGMSCQEDAEIADTKADTTFFDEYRERLPDWLLLRLEHLGFEKPTPVQSSTLEIALPTRDKQIGGDVVIHAQTGSGKTLAYLLPAVAAVEPSRSCVQALIIVPTQELGMQVYKLLRRITTAYGRDTKGETKDEGEEDESEDAELMPFDESDGQATESINTSSLNSGTQGSFPVLPMLNQADLRRQKLQLRQAAPRIIVGNPHRVAELVNSGRLRLDLLKALVVDEFDACLLDTSTTNALQTILSVRRREGARQTILASATVPQHRHFLRQCVRQRWTRSDIEHVWVEEKSGDRVPISLQHFYAICEGRKKLAALRALIVKFSRDAEEDSKGADSRGISIRAIVFVMSSRNISEIVDALNQSLEKLYGTQGEAQVVGICNESSIVHRRNAMKRFRSGAARVLIGTDVAARGLDVADVTHVFHFDLPRDADGYLHRAGRAGRQGKRGVSVVLVAPGEQFVISRTSNSLGIDFERIVKG